jgi:hypothetical protein
MFDLAVGQVLEFIEPATSDGDVIAKGTRVRVGFIWSELAEEKVNIVVMDEQEPRTLTVARHVVTLHCQLVTG